MKELGYGDNYAYAHQYEGNFVYQEFMPEKLSNVNLFKAGSSKKEQEIKNQLEQLWGKKYPSL